MNDQPLRILYIDDDLALARLVQRAAKRRGFEVVHAASADDGLSHVDAGGIDLIALDHYLPVGTGLDLLASLKLRQDVPPVVYVTGSAEMSIAVSALKAGAADYVTKTVSDDFLELLFTSIEQALARSRLSLEKEQAQREVREARDRAETLLREVNHRIANSLSLVATMVRMQSSVLSDPTAVGALAETQARIAAIAGVHRRLYTSANVGSVAIDDYLRGLVDELDASMRSANHQAFIVLESDPVSISPDKAVSLGVVVTELVTNAFKYAYEDNALGEIRVRLRRTGADSATLHVEDDGPGWDGNGQPKGTGLGSKIIKAMATNLGTAIRYETMPKGTRMVMEFLL